MKYMMGQPPQFNFSIAIVVSRFNEEVTKRLLAGALSRLAALGFPEDHITVAYVPGAREIPVIAQQFAKTQQYAAIICLGAVIRGDTDHYTYVCESVTHGCQQVALEYHLPMLFEVLMTDNEAQAMERAGGAQGNKGSDAVDAALEMISVIQQIRSQGQASRISRTSSYEARLDEN